MMRRIRSFWCLSLRVRQADLTERFKKKETEKEIDRKKEGT